jgi:hypothetical protein
VHFVGPDALAGKFVHVDITRATASALYGDLVAGSVR